MPQIIFDTAFFVPRRGSIVREKDLIRSERGLLHLLDALVKINVDYLRDYPNTPRLYESGLRYEREKKPRCSRGRIIGGERWMDIPRLLMQKRLVADCEDLADYRVAELQVFDGIAAEPDLIGWVHGDPQRFTYHVRVRFPDGAIEDPSKILGMKGAA